jgi:hypothetical protein
MCQAAWHLLDVCGAPIDTAHQSPPQGFCEPASERVTCHGRRQAEGCHPDFSEPQLFVEVEVDQVSSRAAYAASAGLRRLLLAEAAVPPPLPLSAALRLYTAPQNLLCNL